MSVPKTPRKRRAPRDVDTGKFAAPSLMDDPELFQQAVRWVQAITELEPLLLGMCTELERSEASAMVVVAATLGVLKQSFLDQLAVDHYSLRDAKNKAVQAKRLGCIPLAEQQRVFDRVNQWAALPSLPRQPRGAFLAEFTTTPFAIQSVDAKPAIEAGGIE